jgi:hypothetical protein
LSPQEEAHYGDLANDVRWLATALAVTGAAAFPQLFLM